MSSAQSLEEPPPARSRFESDMPMPSPPRAMGGVSRRVSALSLQVLTTVAENVNMKSLHRKMTAFSRVLITITFAEDAWRCVSDYAVQVRTMDELAAHGANVVPAQLTMVMPAISALLQSYGVAAVVSDRQASRGCAVLLGWCLLHPFIYGQQRNYLFMSETLTVAGGLLILLAHCRQAQRKGAQAHEGPDAQRRPPDPQDESLTSGLQLAGRMCISCYFVVYAFHKLHCSLSSTHTIVSLPAGLVHGCLMVILSYLCVLVIIGSKSRRIALLLAAVMFVTNLYWHPFWLRLGESADGELAHSQKHLNIVLDGGEETAEQQAVRASSLLDQRGKPLPRALRGLAALGQAAKPRHALQISVYDHERYFFFQRLSTVGALMLLAVHGPGRAAVDSEPSGAAPLSRLMRAVKGED